ncbi:hypothetical protein [uncultured Methylobacterium sp.]|uniref:hypothetical protein n=1 Tax=uncultured Methylobacterium sp. TaxID=157278 RepID=UPI0035CB0289
MLQNFGGVVSAADLDRRGFDLCMAFLQAEVFDRAPVAPAIPAGPAFGRRPGFASPEQVELIRARWREWTGPTGESEATVEAGLHATNATMPTASPAGVRPGSAGPAISSRSSATIQAASNRPTAAPSGCRAPPSCGRR